MQNLFKQLWLEISKQIEESSQNFLKPEPIVLRQRLDKAAQYINSTIDKKKFTEYVHRNDNPERGI